MKKFTLYIGWLLLPVIAFCQKGTTRISFFENKVELFIPAELKQMPSGDTSNFVFEDKPFSARLSVLTSETEMNDNAIPDYADRAIASEKAQRNPATIYDDGVSLNNGKNISWIKYSVEKESSPIFEYVFYGSLDDKLLTFYFTCSASDREKWEKKIDAMVSSLRINDKN